MASSAARLIVGCLASPDRIPGAITFDSKTRAKVEARFAWRAALECLGLARSAERDAVLVRRRPLVECLQFGIQRARELDAAVGAVEVVEVGFELEHVPDVVGAGEAEAPEDVGRHVVKRTSSPSARVSAAAISAPVGCSPAIPTVWPQLAATLEDPVGALADVLDGDARVLLVAQMGQAPFL